MNHTPTQTEKSIITAIGVIIGLALLSSMTSCSVNKATYKIGNAWKQAATKSEVTGWARQYK